MVVRTSQVSERSLVYTLFSYLEPVKTAKEWSDVAGFGSFDDGTMGVLVHPKDTMRDEGKAEVVRVRVMENLQCRQDEQS